ncbi:hypothetical protein B7486_14795 [cyanobacterium TDX16]|nr:hypothetical protein B7486_14795 [cyanobacterium TDX16]
MRQDLREPDGGASCGIRIGLADYPVDPCPWELRGRVIIGRRGRIAPDSGRSCRLGRCLEKQISRRVFGALAAEE